MEQTEQMVRRRTLRRRQRSELLMEYRSDMDIVQRRIDKTPDTDKKTIAGLNVLYDILYEGYKQLLDSEV